MFNLSYEEIVDKIVNEKGIPKQDIQSKVDYKLKQLSDLISKEGAAHIVANELGVKLVNPLQKRRMKIKDVIAGLNSADIVGRVISVYQVRSYNKNGREGKVANFILGDETGTIRVVLWDTNHISNIESGTLKEGIVIKIKNAYVKDNNGYSELHVSNKGKILFDVDEEIGEVSLELKPIYRFKKINQLSKEESGVGIQGTLVQIFEPKFYDICPECSKKVVFESSKFTCAEHGDIVPKVAIVLNCYVDDGTENIRVTAFRDAALRILKLNDVNDLKSNPSLFIDIKDGLIGKEVFVTGRVVKNTMFDRHELIASKVEDADPLEIANKLVDEIAR